MKKRRNEEKELARRLRHLRHLGCPVDFGAIKEDQDSDLELYQVGALGGAQILETSDGQVCYSFEVQVINQKSTPIYGIGLELHLPWLDGSFAWLPDPRPYRRNPLLYMFPGRGGGSFPRDIVLNHRLASEDAPVLAPHVPYAGFLLALGANLPAGLRHGERVKATLVLVASDRSEYSCEIALVCDRSSRRQERTSTDQALQPPAESHAATRKARE